MNGNIIFLTNQKEKGVVFSLSDLFALTQTINEKETNKLMEGARILI